MGRRHRRSAAIRRRSSVQGRSTGVVPGMSRCRRRAAIATRADLRGTGADGLSDLLDDRLVRGFADPGNAPPSGNTEPIRCPRPGASPILAPVRRRRGCTGSARRQCRHTMPGAVRSLSPCSAQSHRISRLGHLVIANVDAALASADGRLVPRDSSCPNSLPSGTRHDDGSFQSHRGSECAPDL